MRARRTNLRYLSEGGLEMARGRWSFVMAGALILVAAGCLQRWASDTKTPRMAKEELKAILGNPNLIIVDVRLEDEWKQAEWKIQGAAREDPEKDVKAWADKYPKGKTLVFYCS